MNAIPVLLSAIIAALSTPAVRSPGAPVVTIHALDFSFKAPTSIKSGPTTFRLVNDGQQLHHLTIFKLAKGKTMADFGAAMKNPGPPPSWG